MDLAKMMQIKSDQQDYMKERERLGNLYNEAIDEFDELVKDCEHYITAECHGENDPECAHDDNEVKWCEAENCPLLK